MPTLGVAARGFEIDAKLELPWRLDGRIAVRELQDTQQPPRAPGFALEGRVTPREPGLGFDLRATEIQQRVVLHAQGSFDPAAGSGDAALRMEPVHFAKGALQPAQLVPQLARRRDLGERNPGSDRPRELLPGAHAAERRSGRARPRLRDAARAGRGPERDAARRGTQPLLDAAGPAGLDRASSVSASI